MSDQSEEILNESHDIKPLMKNYFDYNKIEQIKHGMCLLCGKNSKGNYKVCIPMKGSNTSGLKSHIQRHHKKEYKRLFPSNTLSTSETLSNIKSQRTLDSLLKDSGKKVDKNRMIVTWLSFKNLPKNFFDDMETQNFVAFINDKFSVPNKSQASIMITEELKKMQNNVKELLRKNDSKFAFTLDAWSGKTRKSYYGVSVHYITEEWNLRSFTLDFVPSKGKHSGADIARIFYNISKFYDVTDKIAGITLDNASANTTFISELGQLLRDDDIDFDIQDQHFRCLAHVLNLSVQDILKLMKISSENVDDSIEYSEGENSDISDEESEDFQLNDFSIANLISKIRQLHRKIRNSEILSTKLQSCCNAFDVKFKKPISDS
ncbi:uncharacterized protein LOC131671209 [Phymastichus coffea]|uniref:uncharacterized protein LOC131671209 n=1 Tax=Phymastichus coffea TaxID=108790 RepID=UPI00273CC6C1|nr:uncharacterized protein LOC131671209 [Phymastichus coffea]